MYTFIYEKKEMLQSLFFLLFIWYSFDIFYNSRPLFLLREIIYMFKFKHVFEKKNLTLK